MSLTLYNQYLETSPNQYRLLKIFRPPIYKIEVSNNQLIATAYYKAGSHKYYQLNAEFSNRRLVIADFLLTVEALTDLLRKFPKHAFAMSGFAIVDVTEKLADGLTAIEIKAITEAVWLASNQAKRKLVNIEVYYQGQPINQ